MTRNCPVFSGVTPASMKGWTCSEHVGSSLFDGISTLILWFYDYKEHPHFENPLTATCRWVWRIFSELCSTADPQPILLSTSQVKKKCKLQHAFLRGLVDPSGLAAHSLIVWQSGSADPEQLLLWENQGLDHSHTRMIEPCTVTVGSPAVAGCFDLAPWNYHPCYHRKKRVGQPQNPMENHGIFPWKNNVFPLIPHFQTHAFTFYSYYTYITHIPWNIPENHRKTKHLTSHSIPPEFHLKFHP